MKNFCKSVLLCSGAFALGLAVPVTSAHAQDSGVYLRANAGVGVFSDADLTRDLNSSAHGEGIQGRGNIALSAGVGYEFERNWRMELDYDRLFNDMGAIGQASSSFAKLTSDSLFANLIYDFEPLGRLEPFVGAGIGVSRLTPSFVAHDFVQNGVFGQNPVCQGARVAGQSYSCAVDEKTTDFGWQLMAGLGYEITDNLTWDTHYSYQNFGEADFDGVRTALPSGATSIIGSTMEDVAAHSLVTGFRYRFGDKATVRAVTPPPPPPPLPQTYTCWDSVTEVTDLALCPARPTPPVRTFSCWDNSVVSDLAACPAQPAPTPSPLPPTQSFVCADGLTVVSDLAACPVLETVRFNNCGPSSVNIFNVPANANFEQLERLGTMPEFGDSHGLTPTQFYRKLDDRFRSNARDKAYLNYLFRSMGYANGWSDARPDMFSETVLPVGTRGILGLGEAHHFAFHILPTSSRDREAFRIRSANGTVVHFMKTCGNYMYACD